MELYFKRIIYFSTITWLVFFSLFLFFKLDINSDTLFMEYLHRDLIDHHGSWQLWRLVPAPGYFPDMAAYFLAYYIFPFAPLRIVFVTLVQIFSIALLSHWLIGVLQPKSTYIARIIPVWFLILIVIAANYISPMGMFFNTNNTHVCAFISSLLLLGLYIRFIENPTFIKGIIIVVISTLSYASSAIFILSFLIPFVFSFSLASFVLWRKKVFQEKSLFAFLLLIFSSFLGYIFSNIVTYNNPLQNRTHVNIDSIYSSWEQFIASNKHIFIENNFFVYCVSIVFLFAFCCALFVGLKNIFF
jgi:hypothetical protein